MTTNDTDTAPEFAAPGEFFDVEVGCDDDRHVAISHAHFYDDPTKWQNVGIVLVHHGEQAPRIRNTAGFAVSGPAANALLDDLARIRQQLADVTRERDEARRTHSILYAQHKLLVTALDQIEALARKAGR